MLLSEIQGFRKYHSKSTKKNTSRQTRAGIDLFGETDVIHAIFTIIKIRHELTAMTSDSDIELCDRGNAESCARLANTAQSQSHSAVATWLSKHDISTAYDKEYGRLQRDRMHSRHRALIRLRAKLCASGDSGACRSITDDDLAADAAKHLSASDVSFSASQEVLA
jgi:hypothetical protein